MRTHDRDRALHLREAIHRTGYYPEVVTDGVAAAVAGEEVVAFYVHHEPTFDRDEIRRHLTVVVLTPSRLVVAHTDEHEADELITEAYTSTSTEAISLASVRSVVVTRMVTNPSSGPAPAAEAVVTIGWGGVSRIDLEPAGCQDPECDADHGYTGVLASDDFSIRASATADGPDAVAGLLAFADQLGRHPARVSLDPAAFVQPAYGSRSLLDVVPAIGTAIGVRHRPGTEPVTSLVLPAAPAYVVLLVDGLGARLLERYAHAAPYLSSLLVDQQPGTAGVPSTTATSLSSLGTALPPGSHGLVGFTARIPGTDRLLNHLFWDKDVDPKVWQPHATAFSGLRLNGATVTVINKREFRGSGLTVAAHRGADFVGADRVGERIAAAVTASAERPSLTYLYDGDLDWTGHRYGVASAPWLQQLVMVDAEAEQLRESLPADVRLLVVADHGMVDSPAGSRTDLDRELELRDGVALVGGEARFRHLYCRGGAVDDVVSTWRGLLADRADVLTREQAIGRGWFGAVEPAVLPRIGDVVVACRGDHAVVASLELAYESTLVGLHGSLTPDEMLIPMLVD